MNRKKVAPTGLGLVTFFFFCITLAGGQVFAKGDLKDDITILDQSSKAFVSVVKKAMPAVVHIKVEKTTKGNSNGSSGAEEMFNHPFFEQFFGPQFRQRLPQQQDYVQRGQGSGFIINKKGFILTNNHVVDGADTIQVILSDKREFTGKVVGTDPQSDVALIKIENAVDLPVLPLGDSSTLEVAEWVIAIGNPFGLSQTVTVGVVSATGRSSVGINEYENFIQTDAAINPGNSGGPLINAQGEAVGINTALFSKTGGYMGIGFAIPINMAKSIEKQLMENGKVTRGWLGVVIQNVDKDLAESFGLKQAGGILVSEVQADSPASAAGLKRGDIIIKLDDATLEDVSDLRNRIALITPNSTAMLVVIRDGREKKIQVTIGEQPSDFDQHGSVTGVKSLEEYGLALQELTKELAERFEFEMNSGLIVSSVEPGSPAAKAGMKPGQLVEEINRIPVSNLKDLNKILSETGKNDKILLRVRSGNYATYIVLGAK
ncbi:DegQ family serine endoprotease [Desulforhopalus sp. IMCC35007]|uniref:DegQ family serine endoprotease n=1 Tax=Desulforhopalus sp. IMCC35007 TaxID=2569543 RepID=UPI0010AE9942|nr:DegQ family serine endoprotease [Desulforhopalus sp. IMCC35007]TKB11590.1 DegQ family serine endoprotease [Desulforhopalus sp. IMCC35007]